MTLTNGQVDEALSLAEQYGVAKAAEMTGLTESAIRGCIWEDVVRCNGYRSMTLAQLRAGVDAMSHLPGDYTIGSGWYEVTGMSVCHERRIIDMHNTE